MWKLREKWSKKAGSIWISLITPKICIPESSTPASWGTMGELWGRKNIPKTPTILQYMWIWALWLTSQDFKNCGRKWGLNRKFTLVNQMKNAAALRDERSPRLTVEESAVAYLQSRVAFKRTHKNRRKPRNRCADRTRAHTAARQRNIRDEE